MWNNTPKSRGENNFPEPVMEKLTLNSNDNHRIIIPYCEEIGGTFQTIIRDYKTNFQLNLNGKPLYSVPDTSQFGEENSSAQVLVNTFFDKMRQIKESDLTDEEKKEARKALNDKFPLKQGNIIPISAGEDYIIPDIKTVDFADRIKSWQMPRMVMVVGVVEMNEDDEPIIDEETGYPKFSIKALSLSQSIYHSAIMKTAYGIGAAELAADEKEKNYLGIFNRTVEGNLEVPDNPSDMIRVQSVVLKAFGKARNSKFKSKVLGKGVTSVMEQFPDFDKKVIEAIKALDLNGDEGLKNLAIACRMYRTEETLAKVLNPYIAKFEKMTPQDLIAAAGADKPIEGSIAEQTAAIEDATSAALEGI